MTETVPAWPADAREEGEGGVESEDGAEEGTRTPTPLRVHGPEPCASANSATSAREGCPARTAGRAAIFRLLFCKICVNQGTKEDVSILFQDNVIGCFKCI